MKTLRFVLWAAVAAALAASFGVTGWRLADREGMREASEEAASAFRPSFTLSDHRGEAVTQRTYRGDWLLVFFGFTNCPDICPTTLGDLARVMDRLGPDAAQVTPLFISIDPARDRVKTLADYVSAFHPAIVGLTGSDAQVAAAAREFKAYYEKLPREAAPDGYSMSHTSAVYLMSPEGGFVRTYRYGTPPDEIVKDLRQRL